MKRGADGIACAFGYRDCHVQHVAGVKIPKRMTDKEANRVVLPIIPRNWVLALDWKPSEEEIDGDPLTRYLENRGETITNEDEWLDHHGWREPAPPRWSCGCTREDPCDKHRGALRGRDWKTGEYL